MKNEISGSILFLFLLLFIIWLSTTGRLKRLVLQFSEFGLKTSNQVAQNEGSTTDGLAPVDPSQGGTLTPTTSSTQWTGPGNTGYQIDPTTGKPITSVGGIPLQPVPGPGQSGYIPPLPNPANYPNSSTTSEIFNTIEQYI